METGNLGLAQGDVVPAEPGRDRVQDGSEVVDIGRAVGGLHPAAGRPVMTTARWGG